MRTALRANEAAQGIFRLIAAFGAGGYDAAMVLVRFNFDISSAALYLGLSRGCEGCAKTGSGEERRACKTCKTALRQRVHRVQDRAIAMLGDRAPATRAPRPQILYGAYNLRSDGEASPRDRVRSFDSGDPEEFAGPEGE